MSGRGGGGAALPAALRDWLLRQCVDEESLAWVELAGDGVHVRDSGGAWARYGLETPAPGADAGSLHEAMAGLLPCEDELVLPRVEVRPGLHADIACVARGRRRWVLWRDVSERTLAAWRVQQRANETMLRAAGMRRVLDRYVGREVSVLIEGGEVRLDAAGERRVIATLFADVRGFTAFNERRDPQEVMDALNEYMAVMVRPVLNERGVVDKIIGDGLMAVFGMLDGGAEAAGHAWRAARRMQDDVAALNADRARRGEEALGVGVGLAMGEAVLGVLGERRRRAFTAIGAHVNLAARLESLADAGEILMDETVCLALRPAPEGLRSRFLDVRGVGRVRAYSWRAERAASGQARSTVSASRDSRNGLGRNTTPSEGSG